MKSHNNVRVAFLFIDASFVVIELGIPSYLKRPCPPSALLINYTIYTQGHHCGNSSPDFRGRNAEGAALRLA